MATDGLFDQMDWHFIVGADEPPVVALDADGIANLADAALPRDEHGNEAFGVCVNCGAEMVEDPQHPWCNDCELDELIDGQAQTR